LVGSMPTPEGMRALPRDVQRIARIARIAPRLAARGLEAWGRRPPPPTGDALTDDAYARGRVESFRHGGLWLARELAYLSCPWGRPRPVPACPLGTRPRPKPRPLHGAPVSSGRVLPLG